MLSIKVNKLYLSWGSSFRPSLTVWHFARTLKLWMHFIEDMWREVLTELSSLVNPRFSLWFDFINFYRHSRTFMEQSQHFSAFNYGWVQKMFVSHFVGGNVGNIFLRRWRMTRELFIQAFVLFRQLSYGAITGRRQTDRWSRIMFVKFSVRIREFWFSSVGPFKTSHCNPSIKCRKCLQFL